MRLSDLHGFSKITIQCHDNPDADAIASGFAMYKYFQARGVDVSFIYGGRFPLQKSDLKLLVEKLGISVSYRNEVEGRISGLLLMVDCQYGTGNVTKFEAEHVAVIDHHQVEMKEDELCEIRPELGSCSTLCWKLMLDEGYDVNADINLSTALYYGLFKDTGEFSEIYNPLDKDMQDALEINKTVFSVVRNSNISRRELRTAGVALIRNLYNENHRYAIIPCDEPCDPNVLGVISDFLLSVDGVDTCCVFNTLEDGHKLSVRSCVKEVKANELAEYLCRGVGSGGGHIDKAGGFIKKSKLEKYQGCVGIEAFVNDRMHQYFEDVEILYANTAKIDVSDLPMYEKKQYVEQYVKATDVYPIDTPITIRTVEGDEDMRITDDLILMIGVRGEIMLSNLERLGAEYDYSDEPYSEKDAIAREIYIPKITNKMTGESVRIDAFGKKCLAKAKKRIYVKKLDHYVKLFTDWDDEIYALVKPGDYLTVTADEKRAVYMISNDILGLTYDKVVE